MGQPVEPLNALSDVGRRVAALQDRAPEAQLDRDAGRARLLAASIPVPPRRPRSRVTVRVATALAAALLLGALALVLRPRAPLRFDVGAGEAGVAGAWIAAPPGEERPIRFSDGSILRLAAGGRARVASVSDRGAEIALERGTLDLSVVHRDDTRWTVRVGPFQVNVIGTRFETSWDPVSERFDVALREGAITVSGPVVGEMRAVRTGERLTVSVASSTLSVTMGPQAASNPPPAEPAQIDVPSAPSVPPPTETDIPAAPPPATVRAVVAPRASASAQPSAAPAVPEAPGWRALALDARYKDALAAAEHEGFEALCDTAGAGDLHALGDAARLGGSTARALQAFTALRRRFPGSAESASAAFILGRIAQDQRKDFGGAVGWFRHYLAEQPAGAFAADASGRLVECTDRMGDREAARLAAERYLARYPGGSHAAYAKGVLERGADTP